MIKFFVPGIARSAGSKKGFIHPATGKLIITADGKYQKVWMDSVKWFALQTTNRMILLEGPIYLTVRVVRKRLKGHYRTGKYAGEIKESKLKEWPTPKPDLHKLVRAIEDALTGIIWKDDSQVCKSSCEKVYGDKPGAEIQIETLT